MVEIIDGFCCIEASTSIYDSTRLGGARQPQIYSTIDISTATKYTLTHFLGCLIYFSLCYGIFVQLIGTTSYCNSSQSLMYMRLLFSSILFWNMWVFEYFWPVYTKVVIFQILK
jgi:hypothetical protein